MSAFVRASDALSRLFGAISMLLLAASVIVVSQMVFVRYALGHSTTWQTEFVIYAVIASTFFGAPYVLMLRGHVGVDLLPHALSPRHAKTLRLAASAVALAFCALVAYASGHFWYEAFSKGWRTDTVWAIPLWIPVLPLPAGMAMVCVQYVAEMLKPHEGPEFVESFGS
ncbi:MAG: TRAP transporter small permease [Rhodobiaceae bacterium]|nr:TRAP transporter small permease [Rhodobiaceae bacterium]